MGKKVSTVVGVIIVLVVAAVAAYLIIRYTAPPKAMERPPSAPGASTAGREGEGQRSEREGRGEQRGPQRGERRGEQQGEGQQPPPGGAGAESGEQPAGE